MNEIYSKDKLTNDFILIAIKEHGIKHTDLKEMPPSLLLRTVIERVGHKQVTNN